MFLPIKFCLNVYHPFKANMCVELQNVNKISDDLQRTRPQQPRVT